MWVRNTEDAYLNCSSLNATFPKESVGVDLSCNDIRCVVLWSDSFIISRLLVQVIEASIDIPLNVFYPFEMNSLTLIISMFKDNRIFPDRNNQESSVVVGVNLSKCNSIGGSNFVQLVALTYELSILTWFLMISSAFCKIFL